MLIVDGLRNSVTSNLSFSSFFGIPKQFEYQPLSLFNSLCWVCTRSIFGFHCGFENVGDGLSIAWQLLG